MIIVFRKFYENINIILHSNIDNEFVIHCAPHKKFYASRRGAPCFSRIGIEKEKSRNWTIESDNIYIFLK